MNTEKLDQRFGGYGLTETGWSAKPNVYWDFKVKLQISPQEHQIIDYLNRRISENGEWSISIKRIALDVGTNKSAVRTSLRSLQERGLVSISENRTSKNTNAPNTYSLQPLWDRIAVLMKERDQDPIPEDLKSARASTMKRAGCYKKQRNRISTAIKRRAGNDKLKHASSKEEDEDLPEDFATDFLGMPSTDEMRRSIVKQAMYVPDDRPDYTLWSLGGPTWLAPEGAEEILGRLYSKSALIKAWNNRDGSTIEFYIKVAGEVLDDWKRLLRLYDPAINGIVEDHSL